MKKQCFLTLLSVLIIISSVNLGAVPLTGVKNDLRPPAVPLITVDPFTSAWSFSDHLYDGSVKHWTGKDLPLLGVIKVDGTCYRFMGKEGLNLKPLVPTSEEKDWTGKYTFNKPQGEWYALKYKDAKWKEGEAAFGTKENEATAKTSWETEDVWVRRIVTLDQDLKGKKVYLEYSHDDDAIIYINGIEVVNTGNACKKNVFLELTPEVLASLRKGQNIIAGFCHNRGGNALLDFGLKIDEGAGDLFPNTATQTALDVQATQTHYTFTCGPVDLKLTFTAPLLMNDLKLLSRPVNYVSYEVSSRDDAKHEVSLYFEASPRWSQDIPNQESTQEINKQGALVYLKSGTVSQHILGKSGDDMRIDWGYFYMAGDRADSRCELGESTSLRKEFVQGGAASNTNTSGRNASMVLVKDLNSCKMASGKLLIGYDDIYSIQYFGTNLRPYWNADGKQSFLQELQGANADYDQVLQRCEQFDRQLMEDAARLGGQKYADLCALAYRQAIAAHKLVKSPNGDLLWFSKENFSNGSIGTVDITYPSAPLFLYYNPELVKGMMNFIFTYSESGKWNKPFPSHDVGTYPLANGQTYGGDMPVEEAGNMLILTAALAQVEGNATYAEKHWKVLTTWADYLSEKGLDPDNQLCTDDFAGHFAHNTNLSIKAILGVASYGKLAAMLGKKELAEKYTEQAKSMAVQWKKMAFDVDHYKLTFDKSGTWSQKYNLVWDKLLSMNIFDPEIGNTEVNYYLTKQNKYGLPLDNRETYTKSDWVMWTATMAKDQTTFEAFVSPIYDFMNETTDRVPMSDWFFTQEPKQRGFQARSVVGGYYIKLLEDKLNHQAK